jgi:hypothetical protein
MDELPQPPPKYLGIYSFPKSGNTWMRQILAELFFDDINACRDVHRHTIHDAPVACLPDGRRIRVYKSHSATLIRKHARQDLEHEAIVYIKRHPLDVFLSYLNFMRTEVNRAPQVKRVFKPFDSVESLVKNGEIGAFLEAFILFGTIEPRFVAAGNWFENVANWNHRYVGPEDARIPVITIRYEDMVERQDRALEPLRDFLGLSHDAVAEAMSRAADKTKKDGKFFWKQTPGLYKQMLTKKQIKRFREYHGALVHQLGYEIELP